MSCDLFMPISSLIDIRVKGNSAACCFSPALGENFF